MVAKIDDGVYKSEKRDRKDHAKSQKSKCPFFTLILALRKLIVFVRRHRIDPKVIGVARSYSHLRRPRRLAESHHNRAQWFPCLGWPQRLCAKALNSCSVLPISRVIR